MIFITISIVLLFCFGLAYYLTNKECSWSVEEAKAREASGIYDTIFFREHFRIQYDAYTKKYYPMYKTFYLGKAPAYQLRTWAAPGEVFVSKDLIKASKMAMKFINIRNSPRYTEKAI